MKKAITIALTALITATILASCGQSNNIKTEETPVVIETTAVTTLPLITTSILTSTTPTTSKAETTTLPVLNSDVINFEAIPTFSDSPYVILNDNIPFFYVTKFKAESFEYYSPLDDLERCGMCMACVGIDIMPT